MNYDMILHVILNIASTTMCSSDDCPVCDSTCGTANCAKDELDRTDVSYPLVGPLRSCAGPSRSSSGGVPGTGPQQDGNIRDRCFGRVRRPQNIVSDKISYI